MPCENISTKGRCLATTILNAHYTNISPVVDTGDAARDDYLEIPGFRNVDGSDAFDETRKEKANASKNEGNTN